MAKLFLSYFGFIFLLVTGCQKAQPQSRWCDELPRAAYAEFKKLDYSNDWFEVYEVQDSIYAIYEPFQWQEVISYLIVGREFALLFDSGNGIGSIKEVVTSITNLPIRVLNSHSHYDHVGGNADFDFVYGMDTEFTATRKKGLAHEEVAEEVSQEALCKNLPSGIREADHVIRPYEIDELVGDGFVINLGNRQLKILSVPGHTPDAIALLDEAHGLLWTGDTFYEGPIWLFASETDWKAYKISISRMAGLVPNLRYLLPAHNTPLAEPKLLSELESGISEIESGRVQPKNAGKGKVVYNFEHFSILMASDH